MSLEDIKRVDPEHDRLWREEIKRRHREYKEGKSELLDADEVIAELRSLIAEERP